MAQKDSDYNKCSECGTVIKKVSKRCRGCIAKSDRKATSDEVVLREVAKTSAGKAAKKFGVSISTIRNILLKYR